MELPTIDIVMVSTYIITIILTVILERLIIYGLKKMKAYHKIYLFFKKLWLKISKPDMSVSITMRLLPGNERNVDRIYQQILGFIHKQQNCKNLKSYSSTILFSIDQTHIKITFHTDDHEQLDFIIVEFFEKHVKYGDVSYILAFALQFVSSLASHVRLHLDGGERPRLTIRILGEHQLKSALYTIFSSEIKISAKDKEDLNIIFTEKYVQLDGRYDRNLHRKTLNVIAMNYLLEELEI